MKSWKIEDHYLCKTFTFKDFESSIDFMKQASVQISILDHHPTWTNIYNKVEVKLTTHDKGNVVTEKDLQLAKVMDEIFEGIRRL